MGRVFKKSAAKRGVELEEKEEVVVQKKAKKEKEPEPVEEEEEEEEVSDEEVEDEEEDVEDEDDEDEEEVEDEELQFDFEAFPPAEEDEDGIVNMLTQTFLRTDIDLKGIAKHIIEKSPHGVVITQAHDEEEGDDDEEKEESEEDGMVYGLCTTLNLNEAAKDDAPKFVKDIFSYLLTRAKKGAPSEFYKRLEELQAAGDGKTAMFINERLLNFPSIVVPQVFSNLRTELEQEEWKKYQTFIYIQKIRIAESDGSGASSSGAKEPAKKKGKMGKAEKKRAAAAALASADVEFDNVEDKFLFKVTAGKETHFDYAVHMDVEPGSKFHVVEKDGKKWNPFRRVVIVDAKRLTAFLEKGGEAVVESD